MITENTFQSLSLYCIQKKQIINLNGCHPLALKSGFPRSIFLLFWFSGLASVVYMITAEGYISFDNSNKEKTKT